MDISKFFVILFSPIVSGIFGQDEIRKSQETCSNKLDKIINQLDLISDQMILQKALSLSTLDLILNEHEDIYQKTKVLEIARSISKRYKNDRN